MNNCDTDISGDCPVMTLVVPRTQDGPTKELTHPTENRSRHRFRGTHRSPRCFQRDPAAVGPLPERGSAFLG